MFRINQQLGRYTLAALAAVAALSLRQVLNPLLGQHYPYHTLWLAVVFSAWYCGIGPSIVTVAMCAMGAWYWFLPPYHSFTGKSQTEIFGMLDFLVLSAIIMALGALTRRAIHQRELAEEELKRAHQELEDRVRDRTMALEQTTSELAQKAALLDLANDAIFIRTADDTISYWNEGAKRLYGWSATEALGRSLHDLLHTEFPIPLEEIQQEDYWAGELRHTKRDGTQIVVESRWTTLRDNAGNPVGWMEINTDVTFRKKAEDAARKLSGRILTLQDDERRRIARELHDSLGQLLTALKINLDVLSQHQGNGADLISQCADLAQQSLNETRTLSHLLHPPLLDEAGIGSAVRCYVDGFAQRSGIQVDLDLSPEIDRLHRDVEIALFRAVQEGLTNAYRHSGSSSVNVRLVLDRDHVRLEIEDAGRGMSKEQLSRLMDHGSGSGVGIAGMRERVRELGGSLAIHSGSTGSKLIIAIPMLQESPQSAQNQRSVFAA